MRGITIEGCLLTDEVFTKDSTHRLANFTVFNSQKCKSSEDVKCVQTVVSIELKSSHKVWRGGPFFRMTLDDRGDSVIESQFKVDSERLSSRSSFQLENEFLDTSDP